MKYICLSLNPALDRTIYCELKKGETNIARQSHTAAGGKGINVARALGNFGEKPYVLSFSGGINGEIFESLVKKDIENIDFIKTGCETRVNTKIVDDNYTEINETGGPVTTEEIEVFHKKLWKTVGIMCESPPVTMFLSGSFPQGVEKDVYYFMTQRAKEYGIRVVADCSKEPLKKVIEASPFLIKPNLNELEWLYGKQFSTISEACEFCINIYLISGTNVLLTLGKNGAVFTGKKGQLFVNAPKIVQKSACGAGDTFLAAFIHSFDRTGDIKTALVFACAAGAAAAECESTAAPELKRILELEKEVSVSENIGDLKL